jgi:hypothetical protein
MSFRPEKCRRWVACWCAVFFGCPLPAPAADTPPARRFAVIVGANRGDGADHPLKFAEADAQRFSSVLTSVGDVTPNHVVSLVGPASRDLQRTLDELVGRFHREAWGGKDLLFVYVSSHAAEGELHLDGTRFPIRELKAFLSQVPVGVAILVLDTCEAGVATREKGLRPLSGPVVEVEEPEVTGRVIIASSGANEVSLESDALGSSYFTHHFVAGLRGAADASRDGLVTLQEAYAYAYARTVESTTGARTGRQTPVYDVKLHGTADLVLTEPGRGKGRLRLNMAEPGEFLLVSQNGPTTVERFVKAAGPSVFAIEPGTYRLRLLERLDSRETLVMVPDGGEAIVTEADLSTREATRGRQKGPGAAPWAASATGGVGTGAVPGLNVLGRAEVGVRLRLSGRDETVAAVLALRAAYQQGPAVVDSRFLEREGEVTMGVGVQVQRGPFLPRALFRGGVVFVQQDAAGVRGWWAAEPTEGIELGCSFRLAGPVGIDLAVTPGLEEIGLVSGVAVRPFVNAGVGVALFF